MFCVYNIQEQLLRNRQKYIFDDGCPKAKSSIMKQFENHASNLKLLLQKTDLSLASTATMSDLERVLTGESH